jgi:hypothetical protein
VNFNIVPFESVGSIRFGMTPDEVRQVFPYKFESDPLWSGRYYDEFEELHVVIEYHQQNDVWRCTAVHLSYPSNPIFQGRSLLEQEDEDEREYLALDIEDWLKSIDPKFIDTMLDSNYVSQNLHEDSILFKNLGILLHQPICASATISIYARGCDSL